MREGQKAAILKEILEGESLPSLSPICLQLLRTASEEDSSASDLAKVIENDPGLTARLLKLVSSVYYHRQEKVKSVSQAVVLLGYRRLRVMALGISLRGTFPMGRRDGIDYDQFWKGSLFRAFVAQGFGRLARKKGPVPEEAFVAGLILEIGMLMLFHVLSSKKLVPAVPGVNLPLEEIMEWEEKSFGINHRELGAMVLKRWRFPDALVDVQKLWGAEALNPDRPPLCRIVELARKATEVACWSFGDLDELYNMAKGSFKLPPEEVNRTISKSFQRVEELAEQLSIKMDASTDILNVMENANRALVQITNSMDKSLHALLEQVRRYGESLSRMNAEMAQSKSAVLQNTLDAVAHEIRNPLLAIGGFARRLAREAEQGNNGKQYAEVIVEEARRLERVLDEIMNYSRRYEPSFSERDMISVMEDVIEEFEDILTEKGITLERNFPPGELLVDTDPEGFMHVLRELLRSTIDAMNRGSRMLSIDLQPSQEEQQVVIRISSDSAPMPDRIKDPLLDSNLSSKSFYLGLRLPMVRKILDALDGQIQVREGKDTGNIIDLCLPLRRQGRVKGANALPVL